MLIAELGNNAFGDLVEAKELIFAAHESGADICKMQAGVKSGSMQDEFYRKCAFTMQEYQHLVDYARFIGNDLFFSIFHEDYIDLTLHQRYHKFSAGQVAKYTDEQLACLDSSFVIASFTKIRTPHYFNFINIMFASNYLQMPDLSEIPRMSAYWGRPVGYSDHTVGVETCKKAIELYNCHIVEKHFTIKRNRSYFGQIFRDTIHGATPDEFLELAKFMKGKR